jgi:hypothetical protein
MPLILRLRICGNTVPLTFTWVTVPTVAVPVMLIPRPPLTFSLFLMWMNTQHWKKLYSIFGRSTPLDHMRTGHWFTIRLKLTLVYSSIIRICGNTALVTITWGRYYTVSVVPVPVMLIWYGTSFEFFCVFLSVLRIRDNYPESEFFPSRIRFFPSQIPDPRQRI